MLTLAGRSRLSHSQKTLLATKFELQDEIKQNLEFSKQKDFLVSGEKDNTMQNNLGCKKRQKHGGNFT